MSFEAGQYVYAVWAADNSWYRAKVIQKLEPAAVSAMNPEDIDECRKLDADAAGSSSSSPSSSASPAKASSVSSSSTSSNSSSKAPPPLPTASTAAAATEEAPKTEEEKRALRRARAVREILETEQSYVESLTNLVDVFITPLTQGAEAKDTHAVTVKDWVQPETRSVSRSVYVPSSGAAGARGVPPRGSVMPGGGANLAATAPSAASLFGADTLAPKKRQTLFSNISLIRDLNAKFLTQVQERVDKWTPAACIGDLFVQFAPYFKMYSQYTQNHGDATHLLNKLLASEKYKKFQQFVAFCAKDPRTKGLDLASLLIMPIQRIPRYKLLLQMVYDNTEPSHSDRPHLEKALSLVGDVAKHINEAIRQQQNNAHIVQLQMQFSGDPQLVATGRQFLRQGSLRKKGRNNVMKRYEFFLFNDLLVYAEMSGLTISFKTLKNFGRGLYKLHGKIPLDGQFLVHDMADRGEKEANRFMIVSLTKTFAVYAESAAEKKEWMRDIQGALELRRALKDDNSAFSSLAPPSSSSGSSSLHSSASTGSISSSVSASGSPVCACCGAAFFTAAGGIGAESGVCSACDRLVCDKCSQTRSADHPGPDGGPGRLCDICDKKAKEQRDKAEAAAAASAAASGVPAAPAFDAPPLAPPPPGPPDAPAGPAAPRPRPAAGAGAASDGPSSSSGGAGGGGGSMQEELAKMLQKKRNRAGSADLSGKSVDSSSSSSSSSTAAAPGRKFKVSAAGGANSATLGGRHSIAVSGNGPTHTRTMTEFSGSRKGGMSSLEAHQQAAQAASMEPLSAATLKNAVGALRKTGQQAASTAPAPAAEQGPAPSSQVSPAWIASLPPKLRRKTVGGGEGSAALESAAASARAEAEAEEGTSSSSSSSNTLQVPPPQHQRGRSFTDSPSPSATSASSPDLASLASSTFSSASPSPASPFSPPPPDLHIRMSMTPTRVRPPPPPLPPAGLLTGTRSAASSRSSSPAIVPPAKRKGPPPLPPGVLPPSAASASSSASLTATASAFSARLEQGRDGSGQDWKASQDPEFLRSLLAAAVAEVEELRKRVA